MEGNVAGAEGPGVRGCPIIAGSERTNDLASARRLPSHQPSPQRREGVA